MNLYIHGTGILSAAGNNGEEDFLKNPPEYNTDRLLCKEPDYTAYIPPMQLRRMSKAVRMGIAASKISLHNAGVEKADAISVGTAFGCLNDTEVFLSKMVAQNEQMLTPTAFIQSTHNTVAGQIALLTGCYGHNLTYVHRGHSFEHAMINAQLYLNEHPTEKILVGGIEELTETSLEVLKQTGVYRKAKTSPANILNDYEEGSIAGEGASFFLVSQQPAANNLCVKDIATFQTRDAKTALQKLNDFLLRNELRNDDLDLVMLGINGDKRNEEFYTALRTNVFSRVSQGCYKHICGEHPVASAFGLGVISYAVKNSLPETSVLNHPPKQLKRVLLVNNFLHHYSCWYLEVA
ncbi:MAG TPA: beta-ketoacyl synthase chain length factor [Flavipsychrobacter sp.]|nr:beta-ketoacyl synthase chain length factor [Flavipsychrobacter sp.]